MKTNVLILALILSGCGKVKLQHEVKGHLDPVEVKHVITLDTEALYNYYKIECAKTYTTELDIKNCADEELAKFIEAFTITKTF